MPGRLPTRSGVATKRPELQTRTKRLRTFVLSHHTEDEDSDFSESELPAIAQNGGVVTALTRQEAVDKHNMLVNELDDQVWEPVKMGTKLEDAIIKPENPFSDRAKLSGHWACPTQCLWVGRFPSDSPLQKQTRALYARVESYLGPQALSQKTRNQIGKFLGLWARPGSRAMSTLPGDLQSYHAGIALGFHKCALVQPPTSGLVA